MATKVQFKRNITSSNAKTNYISGAINFTRDTHGIYMDGQKYGLDEEEEIAIAASLNDLEVRKLDLSGGTMTGDLTVNANINATSIYQTSDANKKNITSEITADKANKLLDSVKGYYYTLKDDPDNKEQIGLLAQEVETVFPEVISTDENGVKSMQYDRLVSVLFVLCKDMKKLIAELQSEIKELKK